MRIWHFWSNSLIFLTQYNPPQFVELLMLLLAVILLGIWSITPNWAYEVLAWSYVAGVSASMWVRSLLVPSYQTRTTQVTAVLLLIISIYGFSDLIHYL
jgi:hypothetical protein